MASNLKRYLPLAIILAVGFGAVVAGTLLYRAQRAAVVSATATAANDAAGARPGAKPFHSRGDPQAKLTIEEFADFQCPPCASLSSILHKLEEDYRGRVRIVFRHYPLANHKNARPAALAAEAAGAQGRFWEMHDLLYKEQSAWGAAVDAVPLFNAYAGTLGLDVARFAADLQNKQLSARVGADQTRAAALGVSQTPTVFLNDRLVPAPSLNAADMRALIESALKGDPVP